MKKIIAIITVFVFAVALAGMVCAQADDRTPAEKLAAGRAYLKTLDTRIIEARQLKQTARVKNIQALKASTIAKMQVWKAEAEAAPVAPTPPPPPPVARRPVAAPSAGLLGLGINTGYTVGYMMTGTNLSVITGRGDLILGDALGLGPMVGLSEDAVAWKIGLGGASGKGTNGTKQNAVAIFVDGILNVPADLLGGIESYVGGGLNYIVYRSGGNYGGEVYYGIKGDIGLGGNSYVEIAYNVIRPSDTSMKGIGINVGTELAL